MHNLPKTEIALAAYLALRLDDWNPEQGCSAWVESADRTCKKPVLDGTALCKRHRNVAFKHHEKRVQTELKKQAERIEYRAKKLPEWEAELKTVEADMERYGGLPTTDRAAYGGSMHPTIRRQQLRQLSDTNVQRMARLSERQQQLVELIGGK